MARLAAVYASSCCAWAVKRGSIAVNPFADLPMAPAVERDRVLTDDEIRRVWQATTPAGSFNSVVRMLLLTGQRLNEVAGMVWDELDNDIVTWTIPPARAKNGKAHIVTLSAQARSLVLDRCPLPSAFGANIICSPATRVRLPAGALPNASSTRRAASPAGRCTICGEPWRPTCSGSAFASK
jgi:integrase